MAIAHNSNTIISNYGIWYDSAWAAFQPMGASDSTSARLDLSGNNRHLTGLSTITWTVADGFNGISYPHTPFDLFHIGLGQAFTVIWYGSCSGEYSQYYTNDGWAGTGLRLATSSYNTTFKLVGGCNYGATGVSYTLGYSLFNPMYVAFRKRSDYSMDIRYNNTHQSPIVAGSPYTNDAIGLCCAKGLRAAGIWLRELTDDELDTIYLRLINL
jgi:hypothetical protein